MEKHSFLYEGVNIEYGLVRKKVKNINMRIHSQKGVFVSAGQKVPFVAVDEFVKSKARWILKHMSHIQYEQPAEKAIFHNKTVYYLGEKYSLKLRLSDNDCVYIENDIIWMCIKKEYTEEKLKQMYLAFLKTKAQTVFKEAVEQMRIRCRKYNLKPPQISIRNMKTRWGSCTPKKNAIRLNLQLMKTPVCCIEQVALHELLHFLVPCHNNAFYGFMEEFMPDYKNRINDMETNYKDGIF